VFPHARFQADHFHTVKHIWKHLKKSLLSYRRKIKSSGEEQKDEDLTQLAKQLWKMRWSLLKRIGKTVRPGPVGRRELEDAMPP
jgi:hypothetical protein